MVKKRNSAALRRGKLRIYYDLLSSIREEKINNGTAKPTKVQRRSNMGYDKMLRYVNELVHKGLILKKPLLWITPKGEKFMLEYEKFKVQFDEMRTTYLC